MRKSKVTIQNGVMARDYDEDELTMSEEERKTLTGNYMHV